MHRTVSVDVDVDVDLSDFNTEDLISELETRSGAKLHDLQSIIQVIYEKRRTGLDYESELDLLIFNTLGRIV